MARWFFERKADLVSALGFGLAATGLCFAAFIAVLCTDFGTKLRRFDQAKAYTAAFATPPIALVITIILFEFISSANDRIVSGIAAVLAVYCALITVTMFKNVIDLVGLWQAVDKAKITRERQKEE
jgi:dipeptide/tripeptide permease